MNMSKGAIISLCLVVSLWILGCQLGSFLRPTPTHMGMTKVVLTDTPTPTPVIVPGATAPGATPQPKGYVLQFAQQASSGMATLTGEVQSCSGTHGPWAGEVELAFSAEGMQFSGTGNLQFTVPQGENTATGEVQLAGGGTAKQCIMTQISDPLKFEITFSQDWKNAQMIIGSTGAGMMTFVCPGEPPVEATIPFAAFWGPEPFIVPVNHLEHCP